MSKGVKDCAGDDMPAYIICPYCKVTAAGQPSKSCDCLCHHRNKQ